MSRARLISAFVLTVAIGVGCSDVRLEFPEPDIAEVIVPDEVTISGSYCTSPAADIAYPVKIMFIVDGSGSQQFSDQNRQRVVAVEQTINALIGAPNTFFKVIVFNASVSATPSQFGAPPPPAFTNSMSALLPALTNLAEADTLTDYQGALGLAYAELLRDMTEVFTDPLRGQAELSRTKYVLILISDGLPDPQCRAGLGNDFDPFGMPNRLCEDQEFINCLTQAFPCSSNPAPLCTMCNGMTCDFNGTTCFQQANANQLFGGLGNSELAGGQDYNQAYQILQKVDDIMELQERFEVGEIRVHSGLVLDPLADPAVIALFGDPTQAIPMMEQVAEIGEGIFMSFYGGDSIDFLQLNFDSIKQQRVIRTFFADNHMARMMAAGVLPDTDGDGLVDADEFQAGTNSLVVDTDDDGYSDLFEVRKSGFNFDPLDPCLPPVVYRLGAPPGSTCGPPPMPGNLRSTVNCDYTTQFDPVLNRQVKIFRDTDLDGLHDCEERQLGTNLRSPDTDADGIPDKEDFVAGLDPLRWDFDRDDDQDTIPNGREIEWHLNPIVQQTEVLMRDRYRYSRPQVSTTIDGRPCFDFEARRVKLAATGEAERLQHMGIGANEIRLWIGENLADDLSGQPLYRQACVRTRYVPPSFKVPLCGRIQISEADFYYLPSQDPIFNNPAVSNNLFDPALHCLEGWTDPYVQDPNTGAFNCTTGIQQACKDPLDVGVEDDESCCQECFQ